MNKALYALVFCTLISCGYHFHSIDKSTIEVPYVEGDFDGRFTSLIVKTLSSKGFSCVNTDGNKRLLVKILDKQESQIGYMHDRNDDGSIRRNILPTECRETMKVECILETGDGKEIFGPFTVTSDSDLDFIEQKSPRELSFVDISGVRQRVLNFSLGQLEARENAKEAAADPLYKSLAEKIAERLIWEYGRE